MNNRLREYDWLGYIVIAYIFSFAIRLIWVFAFKDSSSVMWNNEIMINTNDGYYFATVVKDMLLGTNSDNQLLSIALDTYPGTIYSIYFAAKFLPLSLDTIILYAPAIISSLIVIPIILTMRLFKLTFLGFLAALLASITWSFYNRTMIGYFDTDMYAIVFPSFILYFALRFSIYKTVINALIMASLIALYVVFYPQGYATSGGIVVALALYMLVTSREEKSFYIAVVIFAIALIKIYILIKLALFIIIWLFTKKIKIYKLEYYMIVAGVSFWVMFFYSDILSLILSKMAWYTKTGTQSLGLHFYDVAQTIREAGKIPFQTFANRISGSEVSFFVGLLGYLLLIFKYRPLLISLPLVAIGFFAHWGGLRFTVYAVPMFAMGAIYFVYFFLEQFKVEKNIKYIVLVISAGLFLFPNIQHVIEYKVPTVLNNQEVQDLEKLNKIATEKDYVFSWWDYGYPIWYYSDTNTLIDGGKHHQDNFLISKILFSTSPTLTANLARVATERYVKDKLAYSPVARELFKDKNVKSYLRKLADKSFIPSTKTRDVYLYLPFRMMNIFPTVGVFGNLNLKTGRAERRILFYPTSLAQQNGSKVLMQNGILFDTVDGTVKIGKNSYKVYKFDQAVLGKNAMPVSNSSLMHIDGKMCVVFLKSYGRMIIMDRETYNSTYVQMFMLGNYDKELFELVVSSPYSKIYKVKR